MTVKVGSKHVKGEHLSIRPRKLIFRNVRVNVPYIEEVTIRNLDRRVRHLKILGTKDRRFTLDRGREKFFLVPGLSAKVRVQFFTDTELAQDISSDIVIAMEDGDAMLPVVALVPKPEIDFEPLLDFGTVVVNNSVAAFVHFTNLGIREGVVKINLPEIQDATIKIDKKEFTVGALGSGKHTNKCRLEMSPKLLGLFRHEAEIELNLGEIRKLNLIAHVCPHTLQLLMSGSKAPLKALHFGYLYFGQVRGFKALLVNNGPKDTMFTSTITVKNEAGADGEGMDDDDTQNLDPEDLGIQLVPSEGVLRAYSENLITFTYEPRSTGRQRGFKQQTKPEDEKILVEFNCKIESRDVSNEITIPISGTGIYPHVVLSQKKFQFGECPVNDRRDFIFEMSNKSADLGIEYEFSKIANFKMKPRMGRLTPLQSTTILASFVPRNFGVFKDSIVLDISKGVETIPIEVSGYSKKYKGNREGHARWGAQLVGGIDKIPCDFKKIIKFVRPEDENVYHSDTDEFECGIVEDVAERPPWDKSTWVKGRVVDFHSDPYVSNYDDVNADEYRNLNYTFAKDEFQRRKSVKVGSNNFIKVLATQRQTKIDEKLKGSKMKNVDIETFLPLEFSKGLKAPIPPLPTTYEELWLKSSSEKSSKAAMDENRLIKKKFKIKPSTQAEMRDCSTALSHKELKKVATHPKIMDFGTVCIHSQHVRNFSVFNPLDRSLMVTLNVTADELGQITPRCQVIPAKSLAGFDIHFSSTQVQNVRADVEFKINDNHTSSFGVVAEVVQLDLETSVDEIEFKFSDTSSDFILSSELTLTNVLEASAKFSISSSSEAIYVQPSSGIVDPLKSQIVEVFFEPNRAPNRYGETEDVLLLKVVDGPEKDIKCRSYTPQAKAVVTAKQLNFGTIPVGQEDRKMVQIKNTGQETPVVFRIMEVLEDVQVIPESGLIDIAGSMQLTCIIVPIPESKDAKKRKYDIAIPLEIRGGKPLLLRMLADAIVPEVKVQQSRIDFGDVTLGASKTHELGLINASDIPATVYLDFREWPEFSISYPAEWAKNPSTPITLCSSKEARGETISSRSFSRPATVGSMLTDASRTLDDDDDNLCAYRIVVPSDSTLDFSLVFQPTKVKPYNFKLPFTMPGTAVPEGLVRDVTANALKPRVKLSCTTLDFADVIVLKKEKALKSPYTQEIEIVNQEPEPVEWCFTGLQAIDNATHDVPPWRIDPIEGTLANNDNVKVMIYFSPTKAVPHELKLSLCLDGDIAKPYLLVDCFASPTYPILSFDRKRVNLPEVPLGTRARTTFQILNHGYENLELQYALPQDVGKIPLEINFPEGLIVGLGRDRLPVEVTFLSKNPMAFTAMVDFIDTDGNKFSIPVSGVTDNSVLTCQPFMYGHKYEIQAEEGQAPQLEMLGRLHTDKDGEKEDENAITVDIQVPPDTLADIAPIMKFLESSNLMTIESGVESFPQEITASNGSQVIKLIEFLSGRKIPSKYRPPKKKERPEEKAASLLKQYESMIHFLKQNGALINVQPQHCLMLSQLNRLRTMDEAASVSAKKDSQRKRRIQERLFPLYSYKAWSDIIFQTVKIFIASKVSVKTLGAQEELNNILNLEKILVNSNVFSVNECLLLAWVNCIVNTQSETKKPIVSFSELKTGVALTEVIKFYTGSRSKEIRAVNMKPTTVKHNRENASKILQALRGLGLNFRLTPDDISSPIERNLFLLTLYLWQNLTNYIPKTTIEFCGRLHENLVQTIKLSNPSKAEIGYKVLLEGSKDFTIESTDLKLGPKGSPEDSISFEVSFTSRFTSSVEGRLSFMPRVLPGSTAPAAVPATLVFSLKSVIHSAKPSKTFTIETKMYEPHVLQLPVDNPFNIMVELKVSISVENSKSPRKLKSASRVARRQRGGKRGGRGKQEKQEIVFPIAWHTKSAMLKIKPNATATLPLQFLPFVQGASVCQVMFLDPKAGEFIYEVSGTCTMPSPIESQTFNCKAESTHVKELVIPYRNAGLYRARQLAVERLTLQKKAKAKEELKTSLIPDTVSYVVTVSSPYFIAPQEFMVKQQHSGRKDTKNTGETISEMTKTPRGANKLKVAFNPKGPGAYPCEIILKSSYDTRVYCIEYVAQSEGTQAELEFVTPARQKISQDIPVVNSTNTPWIVAATLTGNYFTGPRELKIAPKKTGYYTLTFDPKWIYKGQGKLVLSNQNTGEKYVYELEGVAEEPLAVDQVEIECKARQVCNQVFKVVNGTKQDQVYRVETDLPHVSGKAKVEVPAGGKVDYLLSITPQMGGITQGSVSFIQADGRFQWYAVEIQASSPEPEKALKITSYLRKAVAVEISISNPLNEPVRFDVDIQGKGLFGEPVLVVGSKEAVTYSLIYSPLSAGKQEAGVYFVNQSLGEFWYKLILVAENPPAIQLPQIECEIGIEQCGDDLELENPTDNTIVMTSSLSNPQNFATIPRSVTIPAFQSRKVKIQYTPSAIGKIQSSEIVFQHPSVGEWHYKVTGLGLMPGRRKVFHVISEMFNRTNKTITFRNAFPEPLSVKVGLNRKPEDKDVWRLFLGKSTQTVPKESSLQIPLLFCPSKMKKYFAEVTVMTEYKGQTMLWIYPIQGVAENPGKQEFTFQTPARTRLQEILSIQLPGLEIPPDTSEKFSYTLQSSGEHETYLSRALKVHLRNEVLKKEEPLEFELDFEPLRPISAPSQLVISKESGGRWVYEVSFTATEPELDDIIRIEAALHRTSSVCFRLTNQWPVTAQFQAYFTADSPFEFSLHPQSGLLEPAGSEGTQFVVSFSPQEYGTMLKAKLIIQTSDMQWTYEVRGTHPHYVPPRAAAASIDNRLSDDITSRMRSSHKTSQHKNYLKKNIESARQRQRGFKVAPR